MTVAHLILRDLDKVTRVAGQNEVLKLLEKRMLVIIIALWNLHEVKVRQTLNFSQA